MGCKTLHLLSLIYSTWWDYNQIPSLFNGFIPDYTARLQAARPANSSFKHMPHQIYDIWMFYILVLFHSTLHFLNVGMVN